MGVNPTELIELAEELIGTATEVSYRAAASRAYYSIFHNGRLLAGALPGNYPRASGSHNRILKKLKDFPLGELERGIVLSIRRVGLLMSQARSIRTKADYYIIDDVSRSEAERVIDYARSIENEVSQLGEYLAQ